MLALGDTRSLERALEAAKAGYDMIGFDVSTPPFEKNIELTRALADFAKLVELFDEHD
jgi:fructose/tagatose bisphosphate aldolase